MKMFCTSLRRLDCTTPNVIPGITLVVHGKEEKEKYLAAGFKDVISSPVVPGLYGLIRQRRWIEQNLCEQGEWVIHVNDRLTGLTALDHEYCQYDQLPWDDYPQSVWRELFKKPCSKEHLLVHAHDLAEKADALGVPVAGFARNSNPFFRKSRWSYSTLIPGYFFIQRANYDDELYEDWDQEDLWRNGIVAHKHGILLADRYVHPNYQWFIEDKGGFGPRKGRVRQIKKEMKAITKRFPGLITPTPLLEYGNIEFKLTPRNRQQLWKWYQNQ